MSLNVLVISNYRDYHSTRPEASIFKGLSEKGFNVHVMTYGDSKHVPEFKQAGVTVVDFHPEKKFDKGEVQRIREYVITHKIDVLHLFNGKAIINGIKATKKLPVKILLYRGYAGNINWWDPTAYWKYLNPRVDNIFCNSIGVEEYIQSKGVFVTPKTITINKGHNVEWYEGYEPYDIKKELGIPEDSFLLVNVANNREMKGINFLLEGFNEISNELPIHLLLVGNDMDNEQNQKILGQGDKKNHVHFLGHRKNVLNIVSSTDVFVLSSIYGESITKSVIEAMSLSVAPIITDIPGNTELVVQNESGLIVPSRNGRVLREAILKLYNDRALCNKLGQNARKRIATVLNHTQTIEKTKKMYEDLFKSN